MSDEAEIRKLMLERGAEAMKASDAELSANPSAETGACWVSSSGYSECVGTMTKASCDKQKDWGYKVTWKAGESC